MKAIIVCLAFAASLAGADFKAGVARVKITPSGPIWLSGYAVRTKPSEGVVHDLWAKAIAVEDNKKGRAVIVTTDLIGLPRAISDVVAARVLKQYGLERSRLLLNSSHTHTGPVVRPNLATMYALSEEDDRRVQEYSQKLTDDLVTVIGGALSDLAPARLDFGRGSVGFGSNRRQRTPQGVKIGTAGAGPVDHEVPVLRVSSPDGKLRAVLFGYACHNTTLTGEFYQISGDYAGFAQSELEKAHPGATALFLMLCGADQNPQPRSSLPLAEQHGKSLATEVSRVLDSKLTTVRPPVRAAFQMVELNFAQHSREDFERELKEGNQYRQRRAQAMLKAYDERRPVRRTPYPVQAIRFNSDLTLVALGGEVVVDYALRLKKEFPGENTVVAGYSNDVMCYIPSLRVLKEGGYEANDSMIYYGQPGPFAEDVEETIIKTVHQVMKRVGRSPGK